jgi:acyl-CoA thioester hydrolase
MTKKYLYKAKVYYEDTDIGGIVYYANYLKFIERARTEMIYQQFKMSHQKLKKIYNIMFVVRTCNIKYVKPANFEDELLITTSIIKKTAVRLNLLQEISRNNELLVSAELELAVVNTKSEVAKLPKDLLNTI